MIHAAGPAAQTRTLAGRSPSRRWRRNAGSSPSLWSTFPSMPAGESNPRRAVREPARRGDFSTTQDTMECAMERKRKNIPARIRWSVFLRDDFKCVYCGAARKDGAVLVVDHGDPFSKGGDDDESNFVTACKPCNDGKRAKVVLPPAADAVGTAGAVIRRGASYKSHLHADWADAFRQVCYEVKYLSASDGLEGLHRIDACNGVDGEYEAGYDFLQIDFQCDFLASDIGKVNVVIAENCDRGCFSGDDRRRIRNAVILGYREPTAIIIGSPWFCYAAVVNERYKGHPVGFTLNDRLERWYDFRSDGWYPDENWDFADPRDDFDLRPVSFCGLAWNATVAEVLAIEGKGVRYGI